MVVANVVTITFSAMKVSRRLHLAVGRLNRSLEQQKLRATLRPSRTSRNGSGQALLGMVRFIGRVVVVELVASSTLLMVESFSVP